jgi:hypothetical protein
MSQQQLHEAHALIEQGRIAEARALLQTLDDPTARQWLAQLNAAKRSRKQSMSIPLPMLIGLAVLIGVGALIVIILLTPTLINRIQSKSAPTPDPQLVTELTYFCTQAKGTNCPTWVQTVMTQYQSAAEVCFAPSSDRLALASCLANADIPPT